MELMQLDFFDKIILESFVLGCGNQCGARVEYPKAQYKKLVQMCLGKYSLHTSVRLLEVCECATYYGDHSKGNILYSDDQVVVFQKFTPKLSKHVVKCMCGKSSIKIPRKLITDLVHVFVSVSPPVLECCQQNVPPHQFAFSDKAFNFTWKPSPTVAVDWQEPITLLDAVKQTTYKFAALPVSLGNKYNEVLKESLAFNVNISSDSDDEDCF